MSDIKKMPDYQTVENQFAQDNLGVSPAEIHGLLTGMLAGGLNTDPIQWQPMLFDYTSSGEPWSKDSLVQVNQMMHVTSDNFNLILKNPADDINLDLLIPSHKETLFERAEGVVEWVVHFITGFGLTEKRNTTKNKDVEEALEDLKNISLMGIDEEDDLEVQANNLLEIIDHIQLCASVIFAEFGIKNENVANKTIH